MSYELIRPGDYQCFNIWSWSRILSLAYMGGWQPAGTKLDYFPADPDKKPIDWDGTYMSNAGQFVTDEDALALAAGLDSLLDCTAGLDMAVVLDESAEVSEPAKEFRHQLNRRPRAHISDQVLMEALGLLRAGWQRQVLRDFALFCRRGGFSIY